MEEDNGWSAYYGVMKYIAPLIMILISVLLVSCGGHDEHDQPGQPDQPMAMNHGHGGLREAPTGPLALAKGDHVVIVGNTFAERMAHFGHFETLLQTQYPDHELVVRNLGWSGDTPSLQPRPLDFGTMEEYLVQEQADVIIACFGMNESFSGEAGRSEFEESLRNKMRTYENNAGTTDTPPKKTQMEARVHSTSVPKRSGKRTRSEMYNHSTQGLRQSANVPTNM